MTSPSPLQYNTYYHIFNRGVNRTNIFIEDDNYAHFLNLYTDYITPIAETYAYCLLRNHFHLLIRTKSEEELSTEQTLRVSLANPDHQMPASRARLDHKKPAKPLGSPSKQFSDFFNAYAKAINSAYERSGSLFQHPFGRVAITTNAQLLQVLAYIHQNPQKHGFVTDFREWKYSSYRTILSTKNTHLSRDTVLSWFEGLQTYLEFHTPSVLLDQAHLHEPEE